MNVITRINNKLPNGWKMNTIWFWIVIAEWLLVPILSVINIIAWVNEYGNYLEHTLNGLYSFLLAFLFVIFLSILLMTLTIIYKEAFEKKD